MANIASKVVREIKRPFRRLLALRSELASARADLTTVKSEIEAVRAELLALTRTLEIYRDLATGQQQPERAPAKNPGSANEPS